VVRQEKRAPSPMPLTHSYGAWRAWGARLTLSPLVQFLVRCRPSFPEEGQTPGCCSNNEPAVRDRPLHEAALGGVFPHGKSRARRAPRIHRLAIGALSSCDPFNEIQDEVVDCISHRRGLDTLEYAKRIERRALPLSVARPRRPVYRGDASGWSAGETFQPRSSAPVARRRRHRARRPSRHSSRP